MDIQKTLHFTDNGAGWDIALRRTIAPKRLNKELRPVAIIPGYGLNSFIFGYHPKGKSMEDFWAEKGFEVWALDLRNQGKARRKGGGRNYRMADIAIQDLAAAFNYITSHTLTRCDRVDAVGCSLGGSYIFVHASLVPDNRLGSIVSIGAPLRWVEIHPALRIAFGSPCLLRYIPLFSVRRLFALASPLAPSLSRILEIYLHTDIVETGKLKEIVNTIENPNRYLNAEIAGWIRDKDLFVEGKNVTYEFREVKNPLLCVLANADGIVPEATVMSAVDFAGSKVKEVVHVGTDKIRMAHADMFISNHAQEMVFTPLAKWMKKQNRRND